MIFIKVLEVVFPVFFLSCLGFYWVKSGFDYPMQFVTRICMNIAVPCLVFVSLMNTKIDLKILLNFAIATLLCYLLIILTFFIIIKLLKINSQTYLSPLSFGNTGNIGLPLAYFAFGEIGLGYAVLVLSITSILSFSIGIWFVSGETSFLKTLKNEPLLAATFLGLIFLATKSQTPIFFTSTLELIGQLAIPFMLITLGVAVANLNSTHLYKALKLSILKLIICLSLSILIGNILALDQIPFYILVLQMSAPVAITSYLLAKKYDADDKAVAGIVITSTIISIIYFPIILYFQLS